MITLIIDEHIPFIKGVLEPFAKIIYAPGDVIDRKMVLEADGLIIRTRTRCDKALLDGSKVRFIATATIGFDHIDTTYCKERGISWYHAPGCNSSSVKQYIASVLLNQYFKNGISLKGLKIGIVGVGHVGSKVAQLVKILGMIPLLNDPPRKRNEHRNDFVSLAEIQETCDIITFHVPLIHEGIDKTFNLAGRAFFERLSQKPFLINSSRGSVVDTVSVINALLTKKISGFAADVWENEPDLDLALLKMTDIATPHIAGYSVEGKANGTAASVRAANQHFNFGLDNWYPSILPPAFNPEILINTNEINEEQPIADAILTSYDVMIDDAAFRNVPSQFENLRNHYPVRREFEAFTLRFRDPIPNHLETFQSLGFKIFTNDK